MRSIIATDNNDLTIGTESSRADVDSKTGAHVDTDPEGTTADKIALTQAVLFVSGEPLSLQHLCRVTELSEADQAAILADLAAKLEADDAAGICLRRLEDRYCLTTKSELSNALEKMFEPRKFAKLSPAAYEALAVVAYNQPVTRSQIETVRGVNSDNVIGRLVERGLIEVSGYLDAPGRPAQFVTTERFLLEVGLSSIDELEPLELMMYGTLQDLEQTVQEQKEDVSSGIDP